MPLEHPYSDLSGGTWLRGNLHTHTTASDGSRPLNEVVNDYVGRGYGYLMLSDHDIYTSQEELDAVESGEMILIPGNEISRGGPHMLHVYPDRLVEPNEDRQKVIDDVIATRGFVIVNHPNWTTRFNHCPIEKMEEWQGYIGMEVYNGVICRLDGSPYATNKWDILLAAGRRIWGFANDDSHQPQDVELGWNVACVKERSVTGVVKALESGRFYGSTGVTITSIEVDGLDIRIETENAQRIVALRQIGKRIATVDSNSIELTVPKGAAYVRFECWGQGESFAWTQPFWVA
ncbi:MAG: CehA/McbA family metallohydrolase [Planctomycetota bacterium]|nr:CehA/McbA family metallohydrolase [Planctomycetota bacterium]